jgi:hypothetical protein
MAKRKTYLLNNIEVKPTERTAKKEIKRRIGESTFKILHEVTPVDQEIGSWKQWVSLDELFVVQ